MGWRIVAVAAAGIAAYLVWGWLFTSAEERVRAAVDALAATLSSKATDPLGQVAALGQLRQRLADDVVVITGTGVEMRGRDAVVGAWQRVRASAERTGVRALDVTVVVGPDGATATVEGVAELTLERGGVPERDVRDVRATFVLGDGEWRLSRAETLEAVTPPQ
jgi:ketosteroid isomerase-like protein